MTKKKALRILTVTTLLVVIANVLFFMGDCFHYTLDDLPTGKLKFTDASNPDYLIKVYEIPARGTLDCGVRCELIDISALKEAYESDAVGANDLETLVKNAPTKNLYWQIGISNAIISWADENVVEINGVSIDVRTATYDWRVYNFMTDENRTS